MSPTGPYHLSGYQARDREIVDYRMYELSGTGLMFRGPLPAILEAGSYFACIGAAQTFGCFCDAPFPDLLAVELGLPALNLGYGGAGPEFFATQDALLPYLNRARFVVLQVMSARSQSNSYYSCGGLEYVTLAGSGAKMGAGKAFAQLLTGPTALARVPVIGRRLANRIARPRAQAVVNEIRAAWVASTLALLDRLTVPVVLFWFSKRQPEYRPNFGTPRTLLGEFPHLVTREMLSPLIPRIEAGGGGYVETVTGRGSPQPLVSRFTGQPARVQTALDRPDLAGPDWTQNLYYPSPEMHEDAAVALKPLCARLVAGGA